MDDDEFEMECMALEAIFAESFRREGRNVSVTVEPVTEDGTALEDWIFTLHVQAAQDYPHSMPEFNVASLENTLYSAEAKRQLTAELEQQAQTMIGEQMIFNLVEWLKDHLPHYVHLSQQDLRKSGDANAAEKTPQEMDKNLPRREKMTKAQKRRFYSRYGAVDEKPRGWNWVDIIAHLSSRPQSAQQS